MDRYSRLAGAAGIAAAVLIFGGFMIYGSDLPKAHDPALKWKVFFADHQNRVQLGLTIVSVGLFFYIWFLGRLREAIALAEGGATRVASTAFGAGIATIAFFLVGMSASLTAAYHPLQLSVSTVRALVDLSIVCGTPAVAGFAVLFAAVAGAGFRFGAVPRWAAAMALVTAVIQVLGIAVAATDHGAFGPEGVFGFILPVASVTITLIALGVALSREPAAAASPAARPATSP